MIKTAAEMHQALRKRAYAGVILYQGPSLLDGAPIVAIATCFKRSRNSKTGSMIQSYIIRSDVDPLKALRLGLDSSVCGFCPQRPKLGGACYVQVGRSVASVFRTFERKRYAAPGIDYDTKILPELFEDRIFRIGSYGDPTAIPFQVWRRATLKVRAHPGYTHQWKDQRFQAFKLLCMASVETEAQHLEATAMGWRTFRVRLLSEPKLVSEVICGASHEAGRKTTCDKCKACSGTSAKAKASIVIINHGPTKNRYAAVRARLALAA
jgi:hypothetical protein